jgi:N-acetylgalactosamine kinase
MTRVGRSSREWRDLLDGDSFRLLKPFRTIYGEDEGLIPLKRKALLELVSRFVSEYGECERLTLVRVPCRINLKGVHVEHRRGEVNYVTHCREVLLAARARADDRVLLRDVESQRFPAREFCIAEEMARGSQQNWLEYLDSPGVKTSVEAAKGDWSNYVKAAVLRLQHQFPDRRLCGMDVVVSGDIPVSSGLSSSSAVVVSSALATRDLNGLHVDQASLVELCGEGEWYVGTRGGAGDHAAMLFGRRGQIAHLRFFPFELLEYVPLPQDHQVVIVNSLKRAHKAGDVLNAYNATIAAYATALMLIKQILVDEMGFPRDRVTQGLKHLGDINLNPDLFPDEVIYRMLKRMPQHMTRDELRARLPDQREALEKTFSTHDEPAAGYRSRAVAMFGLSEIARGHRCIEFLKAGDLDEFGRLMYVSHDGDRLSTGGPSGARKPWDNGKTRVTDRYLNGLLAKLKSGDPAKARSAQLMYQPGGYRCSSDELDTIVDIAKGIRGAGLTGAGFGGCVLVLARKTAVQELLNVLDAQYYTPRGLEPAAEVCVSVAGADVFAV